MDSDERMTLYIAAPLFNSGDRMHNLRLADALERKAGFDTILPQRDGFDFAGLTSALENRINPREISRAFQTIVYSLDIGCFLPRSQVVLANLDEKVDEGVAIEMVYARFMGRHVIGLRTDLRTPYPTGEFQGLHTFAAAQCHTLIVTPGFDDESEFFNRLPHVIAKDADEHGVYARPERLPMYAETNPLLLPALYLAGKLFEGVDDIHSEEGLDEIVNRYNRLEPDKKGLLLPKVTNLFPPRDLLL